MRRQLGVVAVGLVTGLLVVSCDKSPTGPSRPPTGTPGTSGPVTVVRVEVAGPASIEPGATAQFTANAVKSDGTVENVTSSAQWSSGSSLIFRTESPGVVRAVGRGEASISARYQSRTGALRVLSLPAGTYRLTGVVTDTGYPLGGVSVAVIGGTGEGLTSATNSAGGYSFYGVAGQIRLHAKKAGYLNSIETVEVADHRSLDFSMAVDGQRLDLSGTYTLTLTAGCQGTQLPEAAKRRSYTASVEQQGPRVTVKLRDADLIVNGGRGDNFSGVLLGDDKVTFTIGSFYYYFYYYFYSINQFGIVERLDSTTSLGVLGTVTATSSSSSISGTLSGAFITGRSPSPTVFQLASSCSSSTHRFEMQRR